MDMGWFTVCVRLLFTVARAGEVVYLWGGCMVRVRVPLVIISFAQVQCQSCVEAHSWSVFRSSTACGTRDCNWPAPNIIVVWTKLQTCQPAEAGMVHHRSIHNIYHIHPWKLYTSTHIRVMWCVSACVCVRCEPENRCTFSRARAQSVSICVEWKKYQIERGGLAVHSQQQCHSRLNSSAADFLLAKPPENVLYTKLSDICSSQIWKLKGAFDDARWSCVRERARKGVYLVHFNYAQNEREILRSA